MPSAHPRPALQTTSRPRSASRSRQAASVAPSSCSRRRDSACSSRCSSARCPPAPARASRPCRAALAGDPRHARRRSRRCRAPPSPPADAPPRGCPQAWPGRSPRSNTMSFGHLILACSPATSHTASAAISGSSGGGEIRSQHQRHQQRAARRRRPAPPLAPAPGGLLARRHQRAVNGPRECQLARTVARRVDAPQVHARPPRGATLAARPALRSRHGPPRRSSRDPRVVALPSPRGSVGQQRLQQAVDVVLGGLHVDGQPALAQRVAGDRPDRYHARARRKERRAGGLCAVAAPSPAPAASRKLRTVEADVNVT